MILNFLFADFFIKLKISSSIILALSLIFNIISIIILFLLLQKIYSSVLTNIIYLLFCTIILFIRYHYLNKYLENDSLKSR